MKKILAFIILLSSLAFGQTYWGTTKIQDSILTAYDSLAIHLDTLQFHNLRINAAIQRSIDSTSALNLRKINYADTGSVISTQYLMRKTAHDSLLANSNNFMTDNNSPNNIYVFSTFHETSANNYTNPGLATKLYIYVSQDGKQFGALKNRAVYTPSFGTVQDPSIIYYHGLWYVAYDTSCHGYSQVFAIVSSPDLINWTPLVNVDCSSISPLGTGTVYAPEWFVDTDSSLHIFVTISSSGLFAGDIYELHPTNSALSTWSLPVLITGTSLPHTLFDPFMVKKNGVYNLFYMSTVFNGIGYMSSTSMTSGYTITKTGNWAGWQTAPTNFPGYAEGPSLVQINANKWRLYYDDWDYGQYYSESDSTWASWTTPILVSSGNDTISHGTCIKVNSNIAKQQLSMVGFTNQSNFLRSSILNIGTSTMSSMSLPPGIVVFSDSSSSPQLTIEQTNPSGFARIRIYGGMNNIPQLSPFWDIAVGGINASDDFEIYSNKFPNAPFIINASGDLVYNSPDSSGWAAKFSYSSEPTNGAVLLGTRLGKGSIQAAFANNGGAVTDLTLNADGGHVLVGTYTWDGIHLFQVNGSFSSGDITSSGNVTSTTLTPTSLTTGYIPYKSSTILVNSPISINGVYGAFGIAPPSSGTSNFVFGDNINSTVNTISVGNSAGTNTIGFHNASGDWEIGTANLGIGNPTNGFYINVFNSGWKNPFYLDTVGNETITGHIIASFDSATCPSGGIYLGSDGNLHKRASFGNYWLILLGIIIPFLYHNKKRLFGLLLIAFLLISVSTFAQSKQDSINVQQKQYQFQIEVQKEQQLEAELNAQKIKAFDAWKEWQIAAQPFQQAIEQKKIKK